MAYILPSITDLCSNHQQLSSYCVGPYCVYSAFHFCLPRLGGIIMEGTFGSGFSFLLPFFIPSSSAKEGNKLNFVYPFSFCVTHTLTHGSYHFKLIKYSPFTQINSRTSLIFIPLKSLDVSHIVMIVNNTKWHCLSKDNKNTS